MLASQIDKEEDDIDDPNLDYEGIFLACATGSMTLNNIKIDSEDVNDEIEGAMLIDNLDEESLPSEGEDTAESIFLAVTEKRRLLGIEMETNAGNYR